MIKERLIQIVEYKGIAKEKFYKKIGMTSASFRGNAKKTPLNSNAIENILSEIVDLNAEWLLTGKGEMLKIDRDVPEVKATYKVRGIPLLPTDAFAGIGSDIEGINFDIIEERYEIPLFKGIKIDFMIPVRGSSMYPKYSSGDVVACRLITERLFIQWHKVYVLDTISQGVVMKRLNECTNKNNLLCKSDNPKYKPFEIPKKDIRSIALVVGVVRLE